MAPNAKIGYGACTIYAIEDMRNAKYEYVGSCAKPLYTRWGQHLVDAYKNSTDIQKLIRQRWSEFRPVILLGPFACANQRDLNTLEQAYIRLHKPRCNMRSAHRDVVLDLQELLSTLVLVPGEPPKVLKDRLRQTTVEEAWASQSPLRTPRAPRCTPSEPGASPPAEPSAGASPGGSAPQ